MKKKAFLKYLVALLLFGSNGVVAACGRFVFVGAVLFAGRSIYFSSKEKTFGFLALFGSAVFCFVFGRNHAVAANYRCCLDDWRRNGVRAYQKETGSINIKIRPGVFSETDFLRQ